MSDTVAIQTPGLPVAKDAGQALAAEQIARYESLCGVRKAERDTDWQIIAQYALPQESNITNKRTESVSGWTDQIFDTTLIQSVEILAAGIYNFWTPQTQQWNEYVLPTELEGKDRTGEGARWLGEASEKAMQELAASNFYMVKAQGDSGLATFATDCIIVDQEEDGDLLLNFVHCKIGTYVIEENSQGLVDTVRREFELTYRQILQKFSGADDVIPAKMADAAKGAAGQSRKFRLLHCIFPRADSERIPGSRRGPDKPFASVYISLDFKEVIRVSGYDENPILCRRFRKWQTVWGYGPCYLALPDARQVNYVQQYLDALAELKAYPRILMPSNLDGDADLRSGGQTTFDEKNPQGVPREWATVGDWNLGTQMQDQRRQSIRDACFVDAFKLLNSQPLLDKKMTAYEISQRQAEQLQGMTPVDARHIQEFHNPLMTRVLALMYRAGKLGRAPAILIQKSSDGKSSGVVMPKPRSTSRFSDALRALKNRGIEETFGFVSQVGQAKPEVYDLFDLDQTVTDYARNTGLPPDDLRRKTGANSVAAIRAHRAQIQQQMRGLQAAEQIGKAGKGLNASPEWLQNQAENAMTQQPKSA